MKTRIALVLSGGSMFTAWQAGVWRALAPRMQPDLVVGASAGALNGYAIASGGSGDELGEFWMRPELAQFRNLPEIIRALMQHFPLRMEYAAVLTDLLRLRPKIFPGPEITWRHLAASCAIPGVLPQHKIGGRWYSDGGLLNPLPVWAAVELGATHIVAVHALPSIPSVWLKPLATGFRRVAGHHPPVPPHVEVLTIMPPAPLGSVHDALHWRRDNIERWMEQGYQAGKNISLPNCLKR
jgi:predicted acylesterase/phospholipase RssA